MKLLKSNPVFLQGHILHFFILLSILINISSQLFGQAPPTQWKKTYGGTNIDWANTVIQTSDGGYAVTGYTRSYGTMSGWNILLLKTDSLGNQQWIKGYGGNDEDQGFGIIQTVDGGYVIGGYTKSFGAGLKDVVIMKTDSAGNQLWLKTFGGSNDDEAYSMQQLSDGGFILAGATSSMGAGSRDAYLVRTDANGNFVWGKAIGYGLSDGAFGVDVTHDGGFILTGWTGDVGYGDAWLVKTDSGGNKLWDKKFGITGKADRGYCVQLLPDKGFIIGGYTETNSAGLYDAYLFRTDSAGNEKWSKTFGGTGRDYGNLVRLTNDGGFILAGYTLSFGAGSEDVWLIKTDANGNKKWDTTYGGSASDVGNCVRQTSDGGYIIAGYTLSSGAGVHDIYLIKTSSEQNSVTSSIDILQGWNILSIPLLLPDMSISSIFPDAASAAYYYDNGYTTITQAQPGKGFWLKFNSAQTKNLTGTPQNSLMLNLNAGWNMIGPLHNNIPVSGITTNPPGIIASSFYEYSNGYVTTDTLRKGKGYWVKLSAPGIITIAK